HLHDLLLPLRGGLGVGYIGKDRRDRLVYRHDHGGLGYHGAFFRLVLSKIARASWITSGTHDARSWGRCPVLLVDDAHVGGAQALAARIVLGGIGHVITLPYLLEGNIHERGAVEEHVFPPVRGLNEAK